MKTVNANFVFPVLGVTLTFTTCWTKLKMLNVIPDYETPFHKDLSMLRPETNKCRVSSNRAKKNYG